MICVQVRADIRVHAGRQAAISFNLARFAGDAIHIGGWSTQVRDNTGEARHFITDGFYLLDD